MPLIKPTDKRLAQYLIKEIRLKFEEELDTFVATFINQGLPLEDISHVLDMQKFAVDEAIGMDNLI
jgi:hypothetical protein